MFPLPDSRLTPRCESRNIVNTFSGELMRLATTLNKLLNSQRQPVFVYVSLFRRDFLFWDLIATRGGKLTNGDRGTGL